MRISDWSSDVCPSDLVPNAVTQEIGDALHAHWSDEEIVEILGVVSLFGFLNRWNDSMGTSLESGADSFASEVLSGHGWDRSEERRVGKEWGSTGRFWWSACH